MPYVDTNGIKMFYEESGSGDPVILIMGITAPGAVWEAHVADWSQKFRCITPDNRGVGLSDKPAGDYSAAMMADDYAGLMDTLGIQKARIVGVSMGSIIAQELALRHPDKVQSSVLMCPWAKCDRYATAIFNHMIICKSHLRPEQFMEWVQTLIFTKPFWDNDEAHQGMLDGLDGAAIDSNPQPVHGLEGQAAACINHDTSERLKDISCPTLVIGGVNDMFTPKWMNDEVAAAIPNSEQHLYENAGHAFHWECLEDFNPRVSDWLTAH